MRTIVWFRDKDLRLGDHGPLRDALDEGETIPLFVLEPQLLGVEGARARPHATQFLLESLGALAERVASLGSRLVLVSGDAAPTVVELAKCWRADQVFAHRQVEPSARRRDQQISDALGSRFRLYEGETLLPPGSLRTSAGRPYSVFTPFARALARTAMIADASPEPASLPPVPPDIDLSRAATLPSHGSLGIPHNPEVLRGGEGAAHRRLERFLKQAAAHYDLQRDRMDLPGTSRLSADLRFGTLSVRQVWNAVQKVIGDTEAARVFRNELVWREFTHSTLWDRPELLDEPFRPAFVGFPWRDDPTLWRAWTEGRTGYPVVDAAARQLLGEGFVHNRARMISASFLTKHLLIHYRQGEAHYMKYLTDGDPAQNNAGWQWSAGCGCDAQPWFRIFNPLSQGKRFDPDGAYVRRWVPELARLPSRWVHRPWEAPDAVLSGAGVRLGVDYPRPVVDHRSARELFLSLARQHLKPAGEQRQPATSL